MTSLDPAPCEVSRRQVTAKLVKIFQMTKIFVVELFFKAEKEGL